MTSDIKETRGDEEAQRVDNVGVDVKAAELEFEELQREFTRRSTHTHGSTNGKPEFTGEKNAVGGSESTLEGAEFDLEEFLRGTAEDSWGRPKDQKKRIGLLWQDLTVCGQGGEKALVKTFPNAFVDFFSPLLSLLPKKKHPEVEILSDFRGMLKPGEMCLVLGRPGSGCTTFLKIMANQRFGYTRVSGEVQYGRFDADSFAKRYRGEACYNQEDDVHHPTLTVGQTLNFALDTKTGGKLPPGMKKTDVKQRILKMLLRMFNIEHTENTVVGNAQVRGVSGGERKRVSIAEMMITKATVCCWDNATRGLDASTAYDFAKSLRIMTNLYQTTTFVSLYQASENIYAQFDKVLVIDAGREVFFGNVNEARAYFEGIGFMPKPRQTTPDYLTGCTDEHEREYADEADMSTAPQTPKQLEQAFRKSEHWERLNQEMEKYRDVIHDESEVHEEFRNVVKDEKKRGSKKSVYTVPYHMQVWALMKRQFLLRSQDHMHLAVGWFTSIVIALFIGGSYFKVAKTSEGAFNRGGILFISVLFNAFTAFSELGAVMMGRPVLNRHKSFAFHRPSALYVAQIAIDLFFSSAQILVYSVIVYFMTGMYLSAGGFFMFLLFIICAYLTMALFFRVAACMSPDFDSAIKPVGVIITFFVVSCGYLISQQDQQKWISWIFYINGLGLAFASLMANEFKEIDLKCGADSLVPSGPGFDDIRYQTCSLAGAAPGSNIISGTEYVKQTFQYYPSQIWRNFGIMAGLIVGLLLINILVAEYFQFEQGGKTVTLFAKESDESKKLNEELRLKKTLTRTKTKETKAEDRAKEEARLAAEELKIESKAVLTWEKLSYTVPTPSGPRRLLNDIYGYVKPGELTALMGASGAGKTTLLDVLASRKRVGVIEGDVLIDGLKPRASFQRSTAYAEQLDTHEPTQTVREALRFSAYLRQPEDVPIEEKNAYVERVIELLEMEPIADAIIGSPTSGLAVEERKRVTIGVELAAKPELLLFLDEPTSGLDSQSAYNVVRFLKKLATAGQAILCTIHQPNSSLFDNFDRLLLLQKGGEVVYFGDCGKDASTLLSYFAARGAHCPPNANPAEFMLEAIGAGSAPRIGKRDWADIWRDSEEFTNVKKEIEQLKADRIASNKLDNTAEDKSTEYATSRWLQIKLVVKRTTLSFWRSPNYGFTRLFNHIGLGIPSGLAFLNLDNSLSGLQNRVFVLFQATVLPALVLAQVQPRYDFGMMIFKRENSSKMYGQTAFVTGLVLAELPYSILCAAVFWVCIYLPPGLQLAADRAGYQFFIMLIAEIFSVTLGQAMAALAPSAYIAMLLNPLVMVLMGIFCGVTIRPADIPVYFKWIYELDPMTRMMAGMMSTELHGLPARCSSGELSRFAHPPNMSNCEEYVGKFAEKIGGYLVDSGEKGICALCPISNGDAMLATFGMEDAFKNRWRDLGILIAYIVALLFVLYVVVRKFTLRRG